MPIWEWLLESAAGVLLLVLVLGVALIIRRRWLSRHGGTFELSVRDPEHAPGRGWVLGLGRYREDSLDWYRIFSPLPVPRRSWRRNDLTLVSQRRPEASEEYADSMNVLAIKYLNRLSDLLFILARHANRANGDVLWVPGGERG